MSALGQHLPINFVSSITVSADGISPMFMSAFG